ncbi:MAG TPA: hypothetical protein VE956_19550 [Nodularia sp. (in: cyanobacteria)]|nr:hypothetical protein [Nodularia sp. (in: cyanobacteria)]
MSAEVRIYLYSLQEAEFRVYICGRIILIVPIEVGIGINITKSVVYAQTIF